MKEFDCNNIIFSSSATVYGITNKVPISEEEPTKVTNPYGRTKLMIEEILEDVYKSNKKLNVIILRYFNPISCHPLGILKENPKGRPNNLFPIISRVFQNIIPQLQIFGNDYIESHDGTGIRDYIHVMDLADAHICSLDYLMNRNENDGIFKIYNVGTGNGYSVMDMINMFEKIGNKKINYTITDRRKGDSAICYANSDKINNELGWKPKYNLEDMVNHEINRILNEML